MIDVLKLAIDAYAAARDKRTHRRLVDQIDERTLRSATSSC